MDGKKMSEIFCVQHFFAWTGALALAFISHVQRQAAAQRRLRRRLLSLALFCAGRGAWCPGSGVEGSFSRSDGVQATAVALAHGRRH